MTPLQWPLFFHQPPHSWLKQLLPDLYCMPVKRNLKAQLLARCGPDPHAWGDDPLRIRIGQTLCKRIQEAYSWPNNHFLPEDPFDIVFLVPWDDLEVGQVVMRLQEDLDIAIEDAAVVSWAGTKLSNVVDTLLAKCQVQSAKKAGLPESHRSKI